MGISTPTYDVLILGAGISGLVAASILLQQGNKRVLVVDDYQDVGGNHIDCSHAGYTFDVGSLIFQDDSPLVQHFPELLDLYVPIEPSWGKLNPQGVVAEYPFSIRQDFLSAGPIECARMLWSVSLARLRHRPMQNASDFAQYWIGERLLHRSGLANYMERFYGLPAEMIDLKFAQKRMMWIAEHASVRNLVRKYATFPSKPATAHVNNQQLARPREGFAHLYQPTVERLERNGATFLLGANTNALTREGGQFHLQTATGTYTASRVFSTIPLDNMRSLCGMTGDTPLPSVTLLTLFYSFSGTRGFQESILYNFSHHGAWKRLTMYSDFYGRSEDREYFAVEVIVGRDHHRQSVEVSASGFRSHTFENSLFIGDLRLEGSHVLSHAYPIYTEGAGERAEQAIAELRSFGVESFGRQGGFQYQPTSRASTLEAEAAIEHAPTGAPS